MGLKYIKEGGVIALLLLAAAGGMAHAQSEGFPSPPAGGASDSLYGDSTGSAIPGAGMYDQQSRDPSMDLMGADGGESFDSANPFAEEPPPPQRSKEEIEAEIRDRSFTAAITGLLPLNPGEIRKLLRRYDETQQAVEVPVYPYPQPEVAVETVSLDPGVKPPVIKVGVGHVTTLNVMDATGEPWPIQDISWAGNFEVLQPEEGSHVVRITPMSEFAYGNVSVRLLKLNTPVTFTLKTTRDAVQYRFDARIPEFGPFAAAPLIEGGISIVAGSPALNSILDGVPPEGAQKLNVSGVDGRTTAYSYNMMTYVRTPLQLLSPGWSSSVSSADGMNVYTLASAPVLLLSDRGRVVRARVSADEGETQ
jgi:intracellular multiplication protein IcmK